MESKTLIQRNIIMLFILIRTKWFLRKVYKYSDLLRQVKSTKFSEFQDVKTEPRLCRINL